MIRVWFAGRPIGMWPLHPLVGSKDVSQEKRFGTPLGVHSVGAAEVPPLQGWDGQRSRQDGKVPEVQTPATEPCTPLLAAGSLGR